ncbi:MAG: hypothetical protein QM808_13895 [Steroidobacteraceae bacterium]
MNTILSGRRVTVAAMMLIAAGLFAGNSEAADKLPTDFNGVWRITNAVTQLRTADGKEPPLLPEAKQLYEQRKAQYQKKDTSYDASTVTCKPMGHPRIMYDSREFPFEIQQTEKEVFFGYQWNRLMRYIHIGKPQKVLIPLYFGGSEGKWDGNTLVAEVQGLHGDTLLDASGMPHSEDMLLTERYSLKNGGKQMEVRITFNDPATFSKPWDALLVFDKVPGGQIEEDVCVERLKLFK